MTIIVQDFFLCILSPLFYIHTAVFECQEIFCRSLFVLFSYFFWPFCSLSFNLRLLLTPQVFSNFSIDMRHMFLKQTQNISNEIIHNLRYRQNTTVDSRGLVQVIYWCKYYINEELHLSIVNDPVILVQTRLPNRYFKRYNTIQI